MFKLQKLGFDSVIFPRIPFKIRKEAVALLCGQFITKDLGASRGPSKRSAPLPGSRPETEAKDYGCSG